MNRLFQQNPHHRLSVHNQTQKKKNFIVRLSVTQFGYLYVCQTMEHCYSPI